MLVPPLLARFGVARIENDVQGCTLGVREIDPHVEVMERFGCTVERRRYKPADVQLREEPLVERERQL